jgi:hypothetical protein
MSILQQIETLVCWNRTKWTEAELRVVLDRRGVSVLLHDANLVALHNSALDTPIVVSSNVASAYNTAIEIASSRHNRVPDIHVVQEVLAEIDEVSAFELGLSTQVTQDALHRGCLVSWTFSVGEVLHLFGKPVFTRGDGNCGPRSASYLLGANGLGHVDLRQRIARVVYDEWSSYVGHVEVQGGPNNPSIYLRQQQRAGTWWTTVEWMAFAAWADMCIVIVQRVRSNKYTVASTLNVHGRTTRFIHATGTHFEPFHNNPLGKVPVWRVICVERTTR